MGFTKTMLNKWHCYLFAICYLLSIGLLRWPTALMTKQHKAPSHVTLFYFLLFLWRFTPAASLPHNRWPHCHCPSARTWCWAGSRVLHSILCSFNVLLVLCLLLQCSSLGGKHGQPGQVRNYGRGGGCSSKLLCYLCKEEKKKNQKGNSWNRDRQRKRKRKPVSLLQTQTGKKRYMTEKYVAYRVSFGSSLEVLRVRCFP